LVDVDPRRGGHASFRLVDVVRPAWTTVKFVRIQTFEPVEHALVDRSIAVADLEERSGALFVEIVPHSAGGAVDACCLGVE